MESPKQMMLATAVNCSTPVATPQTTASAKAPNENLRSAINDKITAAQRTTKGKKFCIGSVANVINSCPCTPSHPLAFNSASRELRAGRLFLLRRRRIMEHKPVFDLQAIADIQRVDTLPPMSREQRLKRWIALLEADRNRELRSLQQMSL